MKFPVGYKMARIEPNKRLEYIGKGGRTSFKVYRDRQAERIRLSHIADATNTAWAMALKAKKTRNFERLLADLDRDRRESEETLLLTAREKAKKREEKILPRAARLKGRAAGSDLDSPFVAKKSRAFGGTFSGGIGAQPAKPFAKRHQPRQ